VWEIGGLEGAAEDGDCVILGCDIVERLGSTVVAVSSLWMSIMLYTPYYFSTHGCSLFFSGCAGALEDVAAAAASF